MGKTLVRIGLLGVLVIGLSTAIVSCGGGPTSGGEQNFDGTSFVDTDSAAGTIRLEVTHPYMAVGEKSSFVVEVRDASGSPVPNVEIACDTETGLALVEPSTGWEMTDGYGAISGFVGCALPGSFRMGCRLPVGGNKRSFVTVHCSGDVPAGFTGFPGAGGGTLGTGGGTASGDVVTETGEIVIEKVDAYDAGNTSTPDLSIDVVQGTCGTGSSATSEPFFDTLIGVNIKNTGSTPFDIRSFSYQILDSNGQGDSIKTAELAFTNAGEIAGAGSAGGSVEKQFIGLFAKASGGRKTFTGAPEPIPSDLGFKNVTVRVQGTSAFGEDIVLSTRFSMSFGNFNRCTTK